MQIKYITQKSTKQKVFWQPELIDNGDGTVTLQPTTFYFRDLEIEIPEETWTPANGDKIFIENDSDPVHLIRDTHLLDEIPYTPLSGDKTSSPGAVIWVENDTIYVLTHEEG